MVEPKAPTNCDKCELKNFRRRVVNGELRPGSKIFLVGQCPGYLEDLKGKPFIGDSGKELGMVLEKIGLERNELSISNACRCKPPTNRPKDKTLKKEEIRACRQYLIDEIIYVKPNVVVCMGNEALGAILGMKGVMDLRGVFYWSEELGCKVMVTIHPAAALRQWEILPLLEWDLKKAKDGCTTKELPRPQKTNYKVVRNLRHFDALISSLLDAPAWSVDIETTGFDFLTSKILCIGFSLKQRTGIVLPLLGQHESRLWKKEKLFYIRDRLKAVLTEGALKIFQNTGFDWKFLKTFGIAVEGPFFDTMIAHHQLNENLPQSLDFFSRTYTDLGCYDRVIKKYVPSKTKGTFADVPNEVLWRYLAQDADCTFRMFTKLAPKIKEEGLERLFYETTMPFARVLAEAEYRGVLVDRKKLETASKVLESSIKKIRGRLFEEAGHDFNPNSSKQVGVVLFKEKGLRSIKLTPTGAKSTDNEVLTKLAKYHKIAKTLVELRSRQKLKSTYIDGSDGNGGIKRRLDANDRTHPDYSTSGTVTGRLSCRAPDLQNIPRQPSEIRQMFIAPKGWKILESDYSKAELWALACYSGCERLKKDLPFDFHKRTAVAMGIKSRIEDVDKEDTNRAKMLTFGLCYGGREGGLSQSTGLPIGEVREFINKWFKLYPETEVWMNARRKDVLKKGYVTSFLGRRRRFYGLKFVKDKVIRKSEREAINSPIQGLVSDLCCGAAVRIDKWIKENGFKTGLIMTTHDELFYEVPDEELAKIKKIVEQKMTTYIPELGMGMLVDIEVGNCWSEKGKPGSLDLVQLAAERY